MASAERSHPPTARRCPCAVSAMGAYTLSGTDIGGCRIPGTTAASRSTPSRPAAWRRFHTSP
eukprot:3671891-Rhodomonas_salina.2